MVQQRWLIVSVAVLFLVETALKMNGFQTASLAVWFVMILIIAWAVWPAVKGVKIGGWTESQKTLTTLILCVVFTVAILMLMASRKILLWNPDESIRSSLLESKQEETDEEIRDRIRTWVLAAGFKLQVATRDDHILNYILEDSQGRRVTIYALKKNPAVLLCEASVRFDDSDRTSFGRLEDDAKKLLIKQIELELVKFGVDYRLAHDRKNSTLSITVTEQVPNDRSLTSVELLKRIMLVRNAVQLASQMMESINN